jgi:hypothetical protein
VTELSVLFEMLRHPFSTPIPFLYALFITSAVALFYVLRGR